MTLFLFVLLTVLIAYSRNREIYVIGERRMDIQQNARLALGEMTRQIRLASYFPENFEDPPASPLLDNPVRIATDAALAIYGDADGSGASNVFLYCRDGDVLRRARAAVDDTGAYICTSGEVIAANAVDLRFTYYDTDNNPLPDPLNAPYALDGQGVGGLPDMDDTTERDAVRRVVIMLTTREERPHADPLLYTLTSEVVLRNAG